MQLSETSPSAHADEPAEPRVREPAAGLPATQALFDSYVEDGRAPGIVAAIGRAGQPTQFVSAGRGAYAPEAAPVGPDTLWRIYSMTKPVTGMATMLLVEQGKIGLDQPLFEIFPEFRTLRVAVDPEASLESRPAARPITIRHLLTHTAGLGYDFHLPDAIGREYRRLGVLPYAFDPASDAQARKARPTSLEAFAARVAEAPLMTDPGTEWRYAPGLDVLGAVIERVSGVGFEDFLRAHFFAPLGMTSTWFTAPRSEAARLVDNYRFVENAPVVADSAAESLFFEPPSFPYGGGGLVSSARDYDRFLQMLQNGGKLDGVRVMRRETAELALSDLLPEGVVFAGVGGETGGTTAAVPMGFGAGGSLVFAPGDRRRGTYGWGGAAGTIASLDLAKDLRLTLMVNYMPPTQWPLRDDLYAALARDLAA